MPYATRKRKRPILDESDGVVVPERHYELPDGRVASNADIVRSAWESGVGLAELKLHPGQLELYHAQVNLPAHGRLFELCSRRFGKTYEEMVFIEEVARQTRKAVIRFAAPTKQQAREIVIPNWQIITEDCPPGLRAIDRTQQEGCYIWPTTGSRLYLAGTDDTDQIDRLRGPYAHLIIVDELGFHHCDLRRLIHSVLAPQLATTRGKMILSTTPPESMDHSSFYFIRAAQAGDRGYKFIKKTIFDNPLLNDDDRFSICTESNMDAEQKDIPLIFKGEKKGSPAWHREYLCELVTDDSLRVVPEFDKKKHVGECPRPTYFTAYTFIDLAFTRDKCALLFGYYDFKNGRLVIEDECVKNAKVLSEIRDLGVTRELQLWPESKPVRYGDGSALGVGILSTLTSDYNYEVLPCTFGGSTKEVMVNGLREYIGANRVLIHPRCQQLIFQLENGIRKVAESDKLAYQRSENVGHLDAIDALVYGVRSIDWHHNPTPAGKVNEYQSWVNPAKPQLTDTGREAMKIFRGAFKGFN